MRYLCEPDRETLLLGAFPVWAKCDGERTIHSLIQNKRQVASRTWDALGNVPNVGIFIAADKRTILQGPRTEGEVGMGAIAASTPVRLSQALEQIRAARSYTLELLGDLNTEEWFAMPGGVTHIAWQVGHLAMAEYRCCLDRIRGEQPADGELISLAMLTIFGKGSTPDADPLKYPPLDDIRSAFERVHAAAIKECAKLKDADLDAPTHKPHRLFATKLGSLQWCARHEMLHAGQIALLRRMIGRKPNW